MSTLYERIRLLRKKKDITQEELGEILGKGGSAVRMWELGKSNPDSTTLGKLAELFEVSVDYLLARTDDPEPYKKVTQEEVEMQQAFFRFMENAKKEGISQKDLDLALDFLKRARMEDSNQDDEG